MVSQHALQISRGVSQHASQVFRPTPKGELEGSGRWGVSRPTPREVGVGVSQHALRQTPPQLMATAAGGMHPTGMHSCFRRAHRLTVLIVFTCILIYVSMFEDVTVDVEYNTKR